MADLPTFLAKNGAFRLVQIGSKPAPDAARGETLGHAAGHHGDISRTVEVSRVA
jgi:hypothetical protein